MSLAPRLWWRLSSGELEAIVASITFNIRSVEDHPVIEVAAALHGLMASSSILQQKALAIGRSSRTGTISWLPPPCKRMDKVSPLPSLEHSSFSRQQWRPNRDKLSPSLRHYLI
ncbi:hypothetical protein GBA52_026120 [Prunus armeniaca]|nr:hypothetical protein GBA52_026120 [Prunus armeniaca]